MQNELESLVRDRDHADHYRFPASFDSLQFYIWAVRGLLVLVILATLWYARIESKIGETEKWIAAEEKVDAQWAVKHEKSDAYIASNNLVSTGIQNQLDSIRGRVVINESKIAFMEPRLSELWFLKEHGINANESKSPFSAVPTPTPHS